MSCVCHYICVAEQGRIGVFREIHPRVEEDVWIIAQIPASWGNQRATRLVNPAPDGYPIERPRGLLRPFRSQDDAIRQFERWKEGPHEG